MANDPHTHHHVRRVVLPSGKTIEVVYFEEQAAPRRPAHGAPRRGCATCTSAGPATPTLVYPLDWEEAGPAHWEVTLRCPNCEWVGTGVFDQDTVDRFDEVLDEGTDALVARPQAPHAGEHGGRDRALRRTALDDRRTSLPDDF